MINRKTARRRIDGTFLVSAALHIVLGALFVRVIVFGYPLDDLLGRDRPVPAERIGFLALPRADGPPEAGRSGGDGRPETESPPVPEPIMPSAPALTPSEVTVSPPSGVRASAGGSGEIIGQGGATRGVRPTYSDARVWTEPAALIVAPKSAAQRLDSVFAGRLRRFQDSVALAGVERAPGDWTVERDGKKYGVAPGRIFLGSVSIPLPPLSLQTSPGQYSRQKDLAMIRAEIQMQAPRRLTEDDFNAAVRRIRERKDRERETRRARGGSDGSD